MVRTQETTQTGLGGQHLPHTPAPTKAQGPAVALTLEIDGTRYNVSDLDPPHCATLERYKPGQVGGRPLAYSVWAESGAYDPRTTCAGGLACDCEDFKYRHAGTGSAGCKHVRALVAVGLIRPDRSAREETDRERHQRLADDWSDRRWHEDHGR